jgi:hypothetical protein
MKYQHVRTAAIAAASLGLAAGTVLATAGGAEAVARPAVNSHWECDTISGLSSGVVYAYGCSGYGTGAGYIGYTIEVNQYFCYVFSSTQVGVENYNVVGSRCTLPPVT